MLQGHSVLYDQAEIDEQIAEENTTVFQEVPARVAKSPLHPTPECVAVETYVPANIKHGLGTRLFTLSFAYSYSMNTCRTI